jgi:hypothetical protein
MKITHFAYATALVAALAAAASPAFAADEDIYGYKILFAPKNMDKNKDGMISKEEFLAMFEQAYDMKIKAMGVRDGKLNKEQLRELEKTLGRMLGSDALE